MGLADDAAKARRIGHRAVASLRGRRTARRLMVARPPVPDGTVTAVVYFPDLPENLYQVDQWYEPMDERHMRYVGVGTNFVADLEYDEDGLVLNYPEMAVTASVKGLTP